MVARKYLISLIEPTINGPNLIEQRKQNKYRKYDISISMVSLGILRDKDLSTISAYIAWLNF